MRSFIGGASVLLLVVLAQRTLAGSCVRDCSTHCTRYEQAACNAEYVLCNETDIKMNYDTHTTCLQGHVPCFKNLTSPTNNSCWASYLCCLEFNSTNDEDALQECLRFVDLCVDLTGLAFDRCVYRVRCNRSQPIRREDTPPMQNLCFTRRQQNCSCINKRFFNAEITCDMTSSCCLPRKNYSSDMCAAFSSYLGGNTNTEKRAEGYDEVVGDEGLIGDQEMIGDEGALDAFYPDEPFNVTLDKRLPLVRRRATFGRTRLTPRRSVWHERPVRHDNDNAKTSANIKANANANAIFLTKRQDQAVTCGLDKNYYPGIPFTYNTTECRRVAPFYTVEFVQALMLNFTYIMDLAPVGTT